MKIIDSNKIIYKFENEMEHIESVRPNSVFKVKANDCFFQQVDENTENLEKIDFSRVNPATGPIFVEGAEIGDTLKVKILDIEVIDRGVAGTLPVGGVLGDQVDNSIIKIIDIKDDFAIFNDLKLPIKPMIGVIGVAPKKEDGEWPTAIPWKHGGNMDTTEVKKASTLYFPVHQKGALLALGDCHALMADGESCMTGLEIPATVTLEVEVIKGKQVEWPLLETEEDIMVLASGKTLNDASYSATDLIVKILQSSLGYTWEDSYILSSLAMDLKVSQAVNDMQTVRASISKEILPVNKLFKAL